MSDYKKNINNLNKELFDFAEEIETFVGNLLNEFNGRQIKLFDLSPYKRIFLFIFTRAMKSYSAIYVLCQEGYGQDVSTLLRSLLENLVTVKYIIHDENLANERARRFVDYKWIIFKRHLPEEEKDMRQASQEEKDIFIKKKNLIMKNVLEFKNKNHIKSDRALLTWSGKTVKDMAKSINRDLLEEYESTFRLCSRFAHPTILGDNEYIIHDDKNLTFSSLPSEIGILPNLKRAIKYYIGFLEVVCELFQLPFIKDLEKVKFKNQQISENYEKLFSPDNQAPVDKKSPILRESTVLFQIRHL